MWASCSIRLFHAGHDHAVQRDIVDAGPGLEDEGEEDGADAVLRAGFEDTGQVEGAGLGDGADQLEIGSVVGGHLGGEHGGMAALRCADDGIAGTGFGNEIVGGPHRIEHRLPFGFADQIGMDAGRAESGIVGADHHEAFVDHGLQVGEMIGEGIGELAVGAGGIDPLGAGSDGDDLAGFVGGRGGGDHQPADGDRLVVHVGGFVEDAPGFGAGRARRG